MIEIMAVVLIFALMAAFVMPNLSIVSRRAIRHDAERLAAQIELARQRAIVTSVPHRLFLDLESGGYRLEWLGAQDAETAPAAAPDLQAANPRLLEAPRQDARDFVPLAGPFGAFQALDEDVLFAGVRTESGWVDRGEAFVRFERDGSASYGLIVLGNAEGDELEIEVLPLADVARVRDAEG